MLICRQHLHPHPPNGKPHPSQLAQFSAVVQNNPSALPHQLRVGTAIPTTVPGPGQSVATIAPQFNNLGTVGYYRKQVSSHIFNLIDRF